MKNKLISGLLLVVGGLLFIYFAYQQLFKSSLQSNYLFFTTIAFIIYVTTVLKLTLIKGQPANESSAYNIFTLNSKIKISPLFVYLGLFFGLPILLFLIELFIIILNNFYFIIVVYLLITLILFLNSSKKKLAKLFVAIIFGIILYCGFKAKDILRLNVSVEYGDELIYTN